MNVMTDALSRCDFMSPAPTQLIVDSALQLNELQLAACFGLDHIDQSSESVPVTFPKIHHAQPNDETLLSLESQAAMHVSLKDFHGGDNTTRLL
jgi:hypothetical protein